MTDNMHFALKLPRPPGSPVEHFGALCGEPWGDRKVMPLTRQWGEVNCAPCLAERPKHDEWERREERRNLPMGPTLFLDGKIKKAMGQPPTEKVGVTHKAVVVATNELEIARIETTVTLHTWGPACGEPWVPGTMLDRRDERVTCAACVEAGKPPMKRHLSKRIDGGLYVAACGADLDSRSWLFQSWESDTVNCEACLAKKEE